MDQKLTVETRVAGAVYVPVSISEEIMLTQEEYEALKERSDVTLYICTETLVNGDTAVTNIYHGNKLIYSRTDTDFTLSARKYIPYAEKNGFCYISPDGRMYCVPK